MKTTNEIKAEEKAKPLYLREMDLKNKALEALLAIRRYQQSLVWLVKDEPSCAVGEIYGSAIFGADSTGQMQAIVSMKEMLRRDINKIKHG